MSDSYLLTAAERERFATWLERQAETSKGMAKQLETLPNMEVFVKKELHEASAYLTVARILRSTEDMTVG